MDGTMHWMVRAGRTQADAEAPRDGVWSKRSTEFLWTLRPDNANIAKVSRGDTVIAYSYDREAFTHIGVIIGVSEDREAVDATARMWLVPLADPIRRNSLVRSAAWRTEAGSPRTPFSAATTFSQPVNVSDRWETIAELLLPYDRQRFETILEKAGFGSAEDPLTPDPSVPRSVSA